MSPGASLSQIYLQCRQMFEYQSRAWRSSRPFYNVYVLPYLCLSIFSLSTVSTWPARLYFTVDLKGKTPFFVIFHKQSNKSESFCVWATSLKCSQFYINTPGTGSNSPSLHHVPNSRPVYGEGNGIIWPSISHHSFNVAGVCVAA